MEKFKQMEMENPAEKMKILKNNFEKSFNLIETQFKQR